MLKLFGFCCGLWAVLLQANDSSAVTYHFSGGRFGDNLLAYFHAKWISYQSGATLLYKPFPYSDKLALSEIEVPFSQGYPFEIWLSETDNPSLFYDYSDTLFHVKYFPELSWGGECLRKYPEFHVDWDDPGFRAELKRNITPKAGDLNIILPPKDRISVAVHLRNGGKFEPDLHDVWALKAPRDHFYISYIKYLYSYFKEQPLFVYIFTDHANPKQIKKVFQNALKGLNISVSCREQSVDWSSDVLEDFFSMCQFNCSIHGDSNFSVCAGIIADYDIEIRPLSSKLSNHKVVIDDVVMRIHLKKEERPEYRIISK